MTLTTLAAHIRHSVWGVIAFGAFTMPASAQSTLRGRLIDSLRSEAPVAGATIILVGTGRTATTDREGRFQFPAVGEGTHRVAFWAPWLDSLALPAIERAVSVPARGQPSPVSLTTPSRSTFQVQHCGTSLNAEQGVLLGEVRSPVGEPIAGVAVFARWTETTIGSGRLATREVATTDTTTASGFYALCGVPVDAEVSLRAGDDALGSELLAASLREDPVRRRDIVLAPSGERARVVGRIASPDGSALEGAAVVALADSSVRATSDAEGRFALEDVPRRSAQVVVRALGYQPITVDVDPRGERTELAEVRLERVPFELSRVRVDGRVMTQEEFDFEARRRIGVGNFVDEETIKRYPIFGAAPLFEHTKRTRLQCKGSSCTLYLTRANEVCLPRLFVDGAPVGNDEQDFWLQRAKRVEVYRAAHTPPRYNDFDGCGALVVWTR